MGLRTLDITLIHQTALAALTLPVHSSAARWRMIKRAGAFLSEAITMMTKVHHADEKCEAHLNRQSKTLSRRTAQLATANRRVKQGTVQRRRAQETLRKNGMHHARLLEELRHLNHQILSAHENERKKISGELNDETAQTLLGINVRLLTLKREAILNTKRLKKDIINTQRLVNQSARNLLRVARELGIRHEA